MRRDGASAPARRVLDPTCAARVLFYIHPGGSFDTTKIRKRDVMDEMSFQEKMTEIMNRIRELPESERGRAEQASEAVAERRERISKSVGELQESLDYLRLSVKYLIFDLEATRRENAYLRKMIEQSNRDADRRRQDSPRDEDEGQDGLD